MVDMHVLSLSWSQPKLMLEWFKIPNNNRFHKCLKNLHVVDGGVLEDLTVVNVPDCLVVPNFAGQEDGAKRDSFPTSGCYVNLGIFQ
jgi:hypothetical protein